MVITVTFLISCSLVGIFWSTTERFFTYIDSGSIIRMVDAISISAAMWYVFENVRFLYECRFLQYLGKCSIEFYVIHSFLISEFRPILRYYGGANA